MSIIVENKYVTIIIKINIVFYRYLLLFIDIIYDKRV